MEEIETEPITLQGRVFRPVTRSTFAQDMYCMELANQSKIDSLPDISEADLNQLAQKILLDAYKSGNMFKLLAGMLVEDGVKWSEKIAAENATFFEDLTDPAEKESLAGAMAGVVLSFFVNADGFLRTSLKSSSVTVLPGESESESLHHLEGNSNPIEVLTTSGHGT